MTSDKNIDKDFAYQTPWDLRAGFKEAFWEAVLGDVGFVELVAEVREFRPKPQHSSDMVSIGMVGQLSRI